MGNFLEAPYLLEAVVVVLGLALLAVAAKQFEKAE